MYVYSYIFFFFQAEDGIRDLTVTGVQTCALPISISLFFLGGHAALGASSVIVDDKDVADAIARNALVWDVRPADAYARGHIAGAINIGDAARVLRDDNTEDFIATDCIEKIMGAAGLDPNARPSFTVAR